MCQALITIQFEFGFFFPSKVNCNLAFVCLMSVLECSSPNWQLRLWAVWASSSWSFSLPEAADDHILLSLLWPPLWVLHHPPQSVLLWPRYGVPVDGCHGRGRGGLPATMHRSDSDRYETTVHTAKNLSNYIMANDNSDHLSTWQRIFHDNISRWGCCGEHTPSPFLKSTQLAQKVWNLWRIAIFVYNWDGSVAAMGRSLQQHGVRVCNLIVKKNTLDYC